jgi:hypothetical protein
MAGALVPLFQVVQPDIPVKAGSRARADFVAHLIATSAQAPQTRARRRAEPRDAVEAYATRNRGPAFSGQAVSRSL